MHGPLEREGWGSHERPAHRRKAGVHAEPMQTCCGVPRRPDLRGARETWTRVRFKEVALSRTHPPRTQALLSCFLLHRNCFGTKKLTHGTWEKKHEANSKRWITWLVCR